MLANLLYAFALALVSPIVVYRMVRHGRYRRGLFQKLFGLGRADALALLAAASRTSTHHLLDDDDDEALDGPRVWIHAVSVGEVNLLPTVVRRLKRQIPEARIVISTTTDTGYDLACKHFGANRVFFCPLDFTWSVKRTIASLKPEMLVLTELELWPNLVRIASAAGCPVTVINGRLSERSAGRYEKFSFLTQSTFERLAWVGCQDADCRDRFVRCGVPESRLQVTGSMKFDTAVLSRDNMEVQSRQQWAGVDPWHRVWVVGSTQPGEEAMVLELYDELRVAFAELRLVIVPRHAERFDPVAEEIRSFGLKAHRRSQDESQFDSTWSNERVILVDTIGELKYWWGISHIATVGGSFGSRGGQNMLEPAGYGSAVSFGPNTANFDEIATQLVEAGGAVRVHDAEELREFVWRCLIDPPTADALGRAARQVVKRHRGAIDRTVDMLQRLIPTKKSHIRAA